MMVDVIHVERRPELDEELRQCVHRLAAAVERRDGAPPLSDDALLHLGDPARLHLTATDGSARLTGYAQLNDGAAEVLGDRVTVAALLAELEGLSPALTVWSHGRRSPVAAAAGERGYRTGRVLWQLRSTNDAPVASGATDGPADVTIRPFVVGQDEEELLRINRSAFVDLPDQGGWTRADLEDRFAADWFDATGLLVAERTEPGAEPGTGAGTGELLGFHWTKVHPGNLGEVYILAVAPEAQGMRLGRILLQAGLGHLRQRGTDGVLLYVDDSNQTALRLYEQNGFSRFNQDIQLQIG
ncbi:mycothiol synthase [Frankineae bacterium MT45]|nr:mycothiol synthase [Frankineae bacterium MT45]